MNGDLTWISLGNEGRRWLEHQVELLSVQSDRQVDGRGNVLLIDTWSIALAEDLLASRRIQEGELLVAAPGGLSTEDLHKATADVREESKKAILSRFCSLGHTGESPETPFSCVIPSNTWNSGDSTLEKIVSRNSNSLKVVRHDRSVYGIVQLLGRCPERTHNFETILQELSHSPPSVALSGTDAFESLCQEMLSQSRVSDSLLRELVATVTRIVAKGHVCGDYVIWIANDELL